MNSSNRYVYTMQIKLSREIRKQRSAMAAKIRNLREKYPVDCYGTKGEMKVTEVENTYLPYIKELEWYATGLSQLVEAREGSDGKV